jgi:thiazole synthase
VKIEVIGDQATLYPDVQATIEATRVLVKEGFTVLPYTSDDIVVAKRLLDAGAAAIMPLGAPIGSGMGIQNQANIRILREMLNTPLIVDAGVGTASDAAIALELGADGVLMNTGIAAAQDPVLMAEAMKHAVVAGRAAYLAGRMPKKLYATASSPVEGVVRYSGDPVIGRSDDQLISRSGDPGWSALALERDDLKCNKQARPSPGFPETRN